MPKLKCLLCHYQGCFEEIKHFCYTDGYCFTSVWRDIYNELHHKRGCHDSGLMCLPLSKNRQTELLQTCCQTELCNNEPFPNITAPPHEEITFTEDEEYASEFPALGYIPIGIAFVFVICLIVASIYLMMTKSKQDKHDPEETAKINIELGAMGNNGNTVGTPDTANFELSSGSGKTGCNPLVQRTLAKNIAVHNLIGSGRYGEVYKGVLYSEDVAIKIFSSRDEASWRREVEIYGIVMLQNENVLSFIGSDVASKNACTQMWLVTAYHALGSLYDYLRLNTLSLADMLSVMNTIVSGINHLHTEVFGTQGKPAIAHRDIKSKNILMKTPNTCCIADFGLAVTHKQTGSVNISYNYRVGTKRYMAPEVLNETLSETYFTSYKQADIYSLALVMWEIVRRTKTDTIEALEYMVPYQNMVQADPSFEEMRQVVCVQECRPEIPQEYCSNEIFNDVINVIRESWSSYPNTRGSATRIKSKLIGLMVEK